MTHRIAELRESGRLVSGARHEVAIPAGDVTVPGSLVLPVEPVGAVIFAHGSGSSRRSPRNHQVAAVLQEAGLATLLFDLLTEEEAGFRRNVFDVPFLAERLGAVTAWFERGSGCRAPIGYFGASTGAAAALWAAADNPRIGAIVSRGGRPDLAEPRLTDVLCPTLLIVGQRDPDVLELNRIALARLDREAELRIVEGASHLFEEPGALHEVAVLARDWFTHHLDGASDES